MIVQQERQVSALAAEELHVIGHYTGSRPGSWGGKSPIGQAERSETQAGVGSAILPQTFYPARGILTWDRRMMWLFACDCAEHVLPLFEQEQRYDDRPRKALGVARRFIAGLAPVHDLQVARDGVAQAIKDMRADLPWDAGLLAASAAASAASGDHAIAAWTAARAAARAPSWSAVWAEAWHSRRYLLGTSLTRAWEIASREERAWQACRLEEYLNIAGPEALAPDPVRKTDLA